MKDNHLENAKTYYHSLYFTPIFICKFSNNDVEVIKIMIIKIASFY